MRDIAPIAGVALGLLLVAANLFWPSSLLVLLGVIVAIGGFIAGAVLHPTPKVEQAIIDAAVERNAEAAASRGYFGYVASFLANLFQRTWIFIAIGILVTGALNLAPLQTTFVFWVIILAALLLLATLVASANYLFVARRTKSAAAFKD